MQSFIFCHVVFLHASLIFHATDSLPAIKHGEKAQGEFYTVLQRLIQNLVLSFLICTCKRKLVIRRSIHVFPSYCSCMLIREKVRII